MTEYDPPLEDSYTEVLLSLDDWATVVASLTAAKRTQLAVKVNRQILAAIQAGA
jgi:hypothetical protein